MRAAYSVFGLILAAAVIATAVQGEEKNSTADEAPKRPERYAEFFPDDDPQGLVQVSNEFSADRKMRGSAGRRSSSQSSGDRPPVSPFDDDENMRPAPRAASNAAPQKQTAAQSQSSEINLTAGAGTPSESSRAVRAVQDRLSVMRKSPNSGEGRPVQAQSGPARVEAGPGSSARVAVGPENASPVPPYMPDIRVSQADPGDESSIVGRNETSSEAGGPSVAKSIVANPSSTAAIGGVPMTSSRRAPVAELASTPVEPDRSLTPSAPVVGAQPIVGSTEAPASRPSLAPPIASTPSRASSGSVPAAPPQVSSTMSASGNVLFARQSPLLGVETTGPRSIIIGKEAVYTVTLTNSSDVPAQDVVVSINIPAWTEVAGTKATNGAAQSAVDDSGEPLLWQLVRLEARSKEQLTIRLVPRESRPFELGVQWTYSPIASKSTIEVREPKLSMNLTGPKEIYFGTSKVYKLTLANMGSADAEHVTLLLSPVDGSPGAPTEHDIGTIRAGDNKLVEIELTARQPGILNLKASALADGNLRADVDQEILVRKAELKLAMTAPETKFAGTVATFSLKITNPGNATAESVQVAAILPPGAKYVASSGGQLVAEQSKVVWTLNSLNAGGEENLELHCVLDSPGGNRMQVVATATGDLSDSVASVTSVEALADLKLAVSDPANPMAIGEEVGYEVHIQNRGQKAAENVDVAVFFSQGVEPISAQGAQHELSPGQVVFRPIASIAPGAEVVLKIKARGEKPGNHVFRAEVSCTAAGTKLASEETTLFYGGDTAKAATRTASRANSEAGSQPGATEETGTVR